MNVVRHSDIPLGWDTLAWELGTFYHHPAWITGVARCLRYRVHWLTVHDGDRLAGGLVLAEVPGLLGGIRLVSFPFSFIAGPMATRAEVATALLGEAEALGRERQAKRVEVKQFGPTAAAPARGWVRTDRYRTYRILPEGGEAAVWKRLHVTSTQQRIRKGQKAGVQVVDGRSPEDWLAMARLEERIQQGHGVPAPPRALFLDVCRTLQNAGLADLYLAKVPDGRVAAGFVMFKGPREWIYAFSASDPGLVKEYRPTHVLLWAGLQRAVAAGVVLDLGRTSPEQGSLAEFKERWGARADTLAYDYWPDAGGLLNARRDRGALAAAAKVWAALPAPVARLGSALYRYLG
ncbi:MAG TPA: GNAT family N-acetyltransferase [Gemmatimonadales bacterium]|nr:GNAT family N-acetyltransferase [Gemmatimonadales bacterium]